MSNTSADLGAMWLEFNRRLSETAMQLGQARVPGLGCSMKKEVWRQGKIVLYRYLPLPFIHASRAHPVLICYAMVNRPHVLDLQPERSLIRSLLAAGLEVYLIDWGRPDVADRSTELHDYIERYLGGCVRHVLEAHDIDSLNLLGVCQGGTLSLCYTALNPSHVANLVTMVTPVDFHTADNLLSRWARHLDVELIRRTGNLSGELLTGLFLSLRPFRLMQQKYVALLDQLPDSEALDTFCRMEQWVFDSPDQPAAAAAQFVKWFYQENRLTRGTLELGGQRVELKRIRQPVLNIFATQDHIVPPSASAALGGYIGSPDYTEHPVDTGHIGMYISHQVQRIVPAKISAWLAERT